MKHYLDEKYAAADHTILTYSGSNTSLQIPAQLDDVIIRTIGAGSFMELPDLRYVMVPPKVTSIEMYAFAGNKNLVGVILPGTIKNVGGAAFHNCEQLSDITFYDFPMEEQEYRELKDASLRAGNGIYVAKKVPELEIINEVMNSVAGISAAWCVPEYINRLFYTPQLEGDKGVQSIYRDINNICFAGSSSGRITEDEAFTEYLSGYSEEPYVENVDEINDRFLRINKPPACQKTAIFTFDDAKTQDIHGKKSMSVTLRFGYFFWQSACRVICDGKRYYVYRRYYLSPDKSMQFTRRDVAIYTDEGVVMDKKEAQKVYAKYRFLCIL